MGSGVYFKTWTGTVNGSPPVGGGGGGGTRLKVFRVETSRLMVLLPGPLGFVSNVVTKNVSLDRVSLPIHVYQTNGGHSYVILGSIE